MSVEDASISLRQTTVKENHVSRASALISAIPQLAHKDDLRLIVLVTSKGRTTPEL